MRLVAAVGYGGPGGVSSRWDTARVFLATLAGRAYPGSAVGGCFVYEVDVVVGQVVPAVSAAIAAYGASVLARAEDGAADTTVRLGQRVLSKVWHRSADRPGVEAAVGLLASGDAQAVEVFAGLVRRVLVDDGVLLAEVGELLKAGPGAVSGAGGVSVGGNLDVRADNGSGAAVVNHGGMHFGGPPPGPAPLQG
jgi:hypothetical protein